MIETNQRKMKDDWIKALVRLNACSDAVEWAGGFDTPEKAWQECQRGDWMLWLLGKLSGGTRSESRHKLVFAACQCARLALPYAATGELRPLMAIEATEAWSRHEKGSSLASVRIAAYAASDAASAAYAASDAAYAAYALQKSLTQCADIVRTYYPIAPNLNLRKRKEDGQHEST